MNKLSIRESLRDLSGVMSGIFKDRANLLGSWVCTHKNVLEEKSRSNTTKVVFSAQKRGEEGDENQVFDAYLCRGLIKKMLEQYSLAWSILESLKMMKMMMNLEEFLGFFEREREPRFGEGESEVVWCCSCS